MKTMKSILFAGAVALASLLAPCAQAGQPVVYTVLITNDIPLATAATAPVTTIIPANAVIFSNQLSGATQTNALDCLLQQTVTITADIQPTCVSAGSTAGTNQIGWLTSPDLQLFVPMPNIIVPITSTNRHVNAVFTNVSATPWRYIVFTNLVSTVTNCFTTNGIVGAASTNMLTGGLQLRVIFKGP